jgi:hypothetical protein
MKITDYSAIKDAVLNELVSNDWSIEEYLSKAAILLAVSNIYTTSDLVSGFGQDFRCTFGAAGEEAFQKISIISNKERISIILDSRMSYYKSDVPICGYENLEEDIAYIFKIIQLVLDRIDAQ